MIVQLTRAARAEVDHLVVMAKEVTADCPPLSTGWISCSGQWLESS